MNNPRETCVVELWRGQYANDGLARLDDLNLGALFGIREAYVTGDASDWHLWAEVTAA